MSADTVSWRIAVAPTAALFTSFGTLICCALPALLVSLGAGAAVAGLVSAVPQIAFISAYKEWVFAGAGALLAAAIVLQWRARSLPCPADPAQAAACLRLRQVSIAITGVAVAFYATGFFFAFVAADLLF